MGNAVGMCIARAEPLVIINSAVMIIEKVHNHAVLMK